MSENINFLLKKKQSHISFLKDQLPDFLAKVRFEQKPSWGQMTAQHMIEHLASIVIVSSILSKKERLTPSKSQEETKDFLLKSDAEFPRNLMNPMYKEGLPPYYHPTIEEAKIQLIKNTNTFLKTFETNPLGFSYNPFFGDLDFDDLLILHNKHFIHHLTQFGAH